MHCLFNDENMAAIFVVSYLDKLMELVQNNIFRVLPKVNKEHFNNSNELENKEKHTDNAWPHLQPAYELFLQLVSNKAVEVKSFKGFLTFSFIKKFLGLFDSEEPREREYLKNIGLKIYAKVIVRRAIIRKCFLDCFYTLMEEKYEFAGAPELLDIVALFIDKFPVPLKKYHIQFFETTIIPLYKVQTMELYSQQLLECTRLFLNKDPSLGIQLVTGLLRYWPLCNPAKELIFLTILLEALRVCDITKLEPLIPKLFTRLTKCIASLHFQLADRTMKFFNDNYFLSILKTYKNETFFRLVPVICVVADTHWHILVRKSMNSLKIILKELDVEIYERAQADKDAKILYLVQDPQTLKNKRAEIEKKWKMLSEQASSDSREL